MGSRKTSLGMRIFVIVLVVLMVAGLATTTIYYVVDAISNAIEEKNEQAGTGEDYGAEDDHEHEDEDGGKNY